MLSYNNAITLEINKEMITGKIPNTWILNNLLLRGKFRALNAYIRKKRKG